MTYTKKITLLSIVLFLVIPFLSVLNAQEHEALEKDLEHVRENVDKERESFKPAPFIFKHIADDYSWHIADVGGHPISIPLPVIVYSEEKGLNIFMSSNFHHGHSAYKGFYIELDEKSEFSGKVVEKLASGKVVRPFDISISKNVLSLIISMLILVLIFTSVAKAYVRNKGKAPKGMQSFLEPLIIFIRDDIAKSSIQKNPERFMPYLLTVFFFIFLNNLMGLIPIFPGGANITGNIAVTMVLALATFVITTFSGNKHYWQHIFNAPGVPWWLKLPVPLMPIVEIMGMFTKPFVLMVRLFANITAGHIIALGFYSLIFIFGEKSIFAGYGVSIVSIAFTIFMMVLELLVAFIQAYVFTLLSAIYFGMATEEHH